MYAVGYEVYHHPPYLLIGLHGTGCKCKLINLNQYNLRVYIGPAYFVATYFVPPFREAKFCDVPSLVIIKVGCAVGKKRLRKTDIHGPLLMDFWTLVHSLIFRTEHIGK
jgi:hypothetical protein